MVMKRIKNIQYYIQLLIFKDSICLELLQILHLNYSLLPRFKEFQIDL